MRKSKERSGSLRPGLIGHEYVVTRSYIIPTLHAPVFGRNLRRRTLTRAPSLAWIRQKPESWLVRRLQRQPMPRLLLRTSTSRLTIFALYIHRLSIRARVHCMKLLAQAGLHAGEEDYGEVHGEPTAKVWQDQRTHPRFEG